MKRILGLVVLTLGFASATPAQIGKNVTVPAGSDEDKALTPIYNAPDGPEKVALLDKFMSEYGKGDFELLGDELYVQTYLAQKNYAKVYEFGDKALALDPNSLTTAVNIIRAADAQGDTAKIYDSGEKAAGMIARYKASPAPEGTTADDWAATKDHTVKDADADISYVQYAMVNAAFKTTDPAARAKLFERYAAAFPDSSYTMNVREQTAIAYQQAQDTPHMISTAQAILEKDPNNVSMLILLADVWSDNGQELDKAAANAQKALDVLKGAKKPDNVTDEDWQKQTALEKGIAYSAIGEVDVRKTRNAPAVDAFKQANPLLQGNNYYYGRNLYRLGFTLAKMQRTAEARTVLTEAVSVDSPFKSLAQETLNKIGGPVSKRPARKSS
jgi:tetratricopeptide (TPR) repeat protein